MPPNVAQWNDHLEWSLGLGGHGALWAMALLLAAAMLALGWLNLRALLQPWRRWLLFGLRALTVTALLAVLAQPTWVSSVQRPDAKQLAILVDVSASMAAGQPGQRRWDRALAATKQMAQATGAMIWAVGERAVPVRNIDDLAKQRPAGGATELMAGLRALQGSAAAEGLRGVVVVSDGLDTGELRARNPVNAGSLDAETQEIVRSLQVPIHGVAIDDPQPIKDVAVTALRVSQFGFARTYLPVAVDLELSGVAQTQGALTLQLLDNGKPLASQQVPLAGLQRRTVELEFQPLHVGVHVIEAAVSALPDEATLANNHAFAGLSVVRDRVRVLHLAGQPSWDTRFLRTHLRGAPNVDLVSFYIMVGEGAGAYVAGEDTTLIPFPAKEIFEDALSGFDVVILHNFPYGPFQLDQYMPQVGRHIRSGGGLLVLGGPLALSAGGYYGTPLADLLPVQLAPPGDDGGWSEGKVAVALTPLGLTHPVAMLGRDAKDNEAAWARHSIFGRNSGVQPRQDTGLLVTDAKERTLLAVGDVEQGRSAVLASASLWTWAFGADTAEASQEPQGKPNETDARNDYHRLLNQIIAWLVRDPDYELIVLEPPHDAVPTGAPVKIGVRMRDGAGQPLANVALKWAAVEPSRGQGELHPSEVGPLTDDKGQATLQIPSLPAGAWLVVVEADWQGRPQRAVAPVVVADAPVESAQIQPNDRLLQLLAKASGGTVWQNGAPAKGVPLAAPDRDDLLAQSELVHTDVWSRPEVLLLLVALLSAEWILRRRWGLA